MGTSDADLSTSANNKENSMFIDWPLLDKDSEEFDRFVASLKENFNGSNSKNLCTFCWCLCNRYQMHKHKQQGHNVITPRYFNDKEKFIQLAEQLCRVSQDEGKLKYHRIVPHSEFIFNKVPVSC